MTKEPSKTDKLYLAGPMTGYADKNIPAFKAAAEHLRKLGMTIIVPHEVAAEAGLDENTSPYEKLLEVCLDELFECDAIILLDGWSMSKGARRELEMAVENNMDVYSLMADPWALLYLGKGPIV